MTNRLKNAHTYTVHTQKYKQTSEAHWLQVSAITGTSDARAGRVKNLNKNNLKKHIHGSVYSFIFFMCSSIILLCPTFSSISRLLAKLIYPSLSVSSFPLSLSPSKTRLPFPSPSKASLSFPSSPLPLNFSLPSSSLSSPPPPPFLHFSLPFPFSSIHDLLSPFPLSPSVSLSLSLSRLIHRPCVKNTCENTLYNMSTPRVFRLGQYIRSVEQVIEYVTFELVQSLW